MSPMHRRRPDRSSRFFPTSPFPQPKFPISPLPAAIAKPALPLFLSSLPPSFSSFRRHIDAPSPFVFFTLSLFQSVSLYFSSLSLFLFQPCAPLLGNGKYENKLKRRCPSARSFAVREIEEKRIFRSSDPRPKEGLTACTFSGFFLNISLFPSVSNILRWRCKS